MTRDVPPDRRPGTLDLLVLRSLTRQPITRVLEAAKMLPVFALLFVGASLVLLLTCANVGNLQLARAAARRRELTVRLALGAGRRRIIRQLLTEGLLLSAAATSICLIVSSVAARAIMARLDPSVARILDFSIDARVLLFATTIVVATSLVTSLAPALRGTRHLVAGRPGDRPGLRMRSTFLAAQVATSVVLLIAAVLLSRGLAQAASQDVGFKLDTLMAMKIERQSQGRDGDRVFLRDVMAPLAGRQVAAAAAEPLGDMSFHTGVRRADEPDGADRPARFQPVSSSYFDVLGMPLRAGRTFSDARTDEVVLNETLAMMLWPAGDAVGNSLAGAGGTVGRRVVGVVADAYIAGLGRIEPTISSLPGSWPTCCSIATWWRPTSCGRSLPVSIMDGHTSAPASCSPHRSCCDPETILLTSLLYSAA